MTDESRRLTEAELEDVLEKATELSARSEPGLTVGELREVAREVGIPSEALSEALRQVSRTSPEDGVSVRGWGHQRDTAFVPVSVSDGELALLLKLLHRLGHIPGEAVYDQGAVRWKSDDGHRVEVLCRPSETQVTVHANLRPPARIIVSGLLGTFVLVSFAARLEPDPSVIAMATAGGAGLASLLAYVKLRAARLREEATRMLSGIADALRLVAGGDH